MPGSPVCLDASFLLRLLLNGKTAARAETLSLPAAYDAHYLALAERMGAELWTAATRLLRAVRDRLSWVRLVAPGEELPGQP